MADNTTLDPGTGGNVIRTEDRSSVHTPVSLIDVGGTGATEKIIGDHQVRMPVAVETMPVGLLDSFGHLISGSVNNQIDIQWYRSDGSVGDLVTETNNSGGTATETGGMATFACTTSANSQAKGVTAETVRYSSGAEVYAMFTAAFTGTGSGTSYQRIGLYDTNDGIFIGDEGGTFKATVRKGTTDTGVAKGSFSVDTLVGGATSQFTRAGTPEAIDLTKLNVWKITFGWLGSAPIKFYVMAPDGHWVLFHEILQPNNAAVPSLENADLPITCDVNGGNSAAALSILTNCWGAGTTVDLKRIDSTITDATLSTVNKSVLAAYNGSNYVNIQASAAGNLKTSIQEISDGLDVGAGNAGTETQRVSISTDDVNLSAIKTATELIDDAVHVDDASFTPGTSKGVVMMGFAGTQLVDANDAAALACDTDGALHIADGGNSITVDASALDIRALVNTDVVTAELSATDNAVLDTIETNTDFGTVVGGGTEATALRVTLANDSTGVVSIDDNAGSITVDNGGTFAVQAASAGDVAHDSADSGNPVKIGAKVETATSGATLAADGDRTDLYADSDGTLITRTNHPLADLLHNRVTDTGGSSTDFTGNFAAAGASIKNYVTAITIHNSSATDGYVDFRDGSAGTVLWTVPIPAGGGATVCNAGHPLFGTSANTALAYDVSAALSTVYISVSGFKSKV